MATLLILAIMKFFPVVFSVDMYDPIQSTLEDMQVSDLFFSEYRDYSKIHLDTNISIVNNGHLDREELANLINILNKYEPKVIGIDAMFRSLRDPEEDSALATTFSQTKNLVLVCGLQHTDETKVFFDTIATSNPMFNQFAHNGYANVISDDDVSFMTVRMMTPTQYVKDSLVLSFPLKVLSFYNNAKVKKFLKRHNENEVVNFKRNIDKYNTLDISDVFNENKQKLEKIRGKVVLIGYLGPNLKTPVTEDAFFTPMNKFYVGKTDPDMYGIVIHANVISMLLESDYINSTPDWFNYVLTMVILYFNMFFFAFLRENYDFWYQTLSFSYVMLQTLLLSALFILLLRWFNFDVKMTGVFFGILICIPVFEGYTDSLKPLFISNYQKVKKLTDI